MKSPFGSTRHVAEHLSHRVKELRLQRGWTLQQLVNRCVEIEAPWLTYQVLGVIENLPTRVRQRTVSVDDLVALARALSVSVADLLGEYADQRGGACRV